MTKVTVIKSPEPENHKTYYDMEIGTWYDSRSCYGICIKISPKSMFSLAYNKLIRDPAPGWLCRTLDKVTVKIEVPA